MEYLDFIIPIAISIVFVSSYFQVKYSNSMLFISIFILFYQFIAVGYKWQNVPYVIICVYLLAKIYFKFQFKSRFINFVLFFVGIVLFLSSLILNYYLPIPSFEFNNSQYSVGYEEIYIEIDDRKQPKAFIELSNLNDGGNRALLVDIYYPSNEPTNSIQLFKNTQSNWGEFVIKYLNRTWGLNIPTFVLSHLNLSYFDVGKNISIASENFPVVIYTHGWAGEKIFATDQLLEIASSGYVVVAIDHTGLAMFTDLPTGTIYNTGSTENSSDVYSVMHEMSKDIEDTVNYLQDINFTANFSDISIIGHSTGGGSGHLYCLRNRCNKLILQDPYFVPIVEKLSNIELKTDTYFIYSEDWYSNYENPEYTTEIQVYRNFLINDSLAKGYYLTDSAHYDFLAFGAVSPLTKYTFLKGTIDYKDSIFINNKFNLQALQGEEITTSEFLKMVSP